MSTKLFSHTQQIATLPELLQVEEILNCELDESGLTLGDYLLTCNIQVVDTQGNQYPYNLADVADSYSMFGGNPNLPDAHLVMCLANYLLFLTKQDSDANAKGEEMPDFADVLREFHAQGTLKAEICAGIMQESARISAQNPSKKILILEEA